MYHSVYDNYHWMATFADPLFKRHVAVTKMMAGVAARLAGDHRLPFNYSAYAIHLEHDVARLQADVAAQGAPSSLSVEPLFASVSRLLTGAQGIEVEIQVRNQAAPSHTPRIPCTPPTTTTANRSGQQQSMQVHVGEGLPHGGRIWGRRQLRPFTPIPHPPTPPPLPPPQQIAASSSSACRCTRGRGCPMEEGANCPSSKAFDAVNERLFLAERGFLDGHGIGPHYTWFKHLVGGRDESWCEVEWAGVHFGGFAVVLKCGTGELYWRG
ncbi:unnamed protein product [Closterium sp. Naga37s-1]|nr:unnamed protein product [Closterium sp. Naga37s-1]